MHLSWNSLKISYAGARISHLAQKDAIWDFGSMIEQVKTIFMQIEKARKNGQPEFLKKYMTHNGYDSISKKMFDSWSRPGELILDKVAILEVHVKNKHLPDRFCALIKVRRIMKEGADLSTRKAGSQNFSEHWMFHRQGDWWALHYLKEKN